MYSILHCLNAQTDSYEIFFSHRFPGLRLLIEPIDLKKQHKSNIKNVQQDVCVFVGSSYLIPGWETVVISTSS